MKRRKKPVRNFCIRYSAYINPWVEVWLYFVKFYRKLFFINYNYEIYKQRFIMKTLNVQ